VYTKIEDSYGDTITVASSGGHIYIDGEENEGESYTNHSLTPKAAKKLRKALKRAIKDAEAF
jgi:ribosomal protein L22